MSAISIDIRPQSAHRISHNKPYQLLIVTRLDNASGNRDVKTRGLADIPRVGEVADKMVPRRHPGFRQELSARVTDAAWLG